MLFKKKEKKLTDIHLALEVVKIMGERKGRGQSMSLVVEKF